MSSKAPHHPSHHGAHGGRPAHHRPAHHAHTTGADEPEPVLKPPSEASATHSEPANDREAAVALIRQKLDAIYAVDTGANTVIQPAIDTGTPVNAVNAADYVLEPAAQAEMSEVDHTPPPRSKHQQFMYDLRASGKGLAAIQTAWHQYYLGLSDAEKREVWQEFYSSQPHLQPHASPGLTAQAQGTNAAPAASPQSIYPTPTRDPDNGTLTAVPTKPGRAPVYLADDGTDATDAPNTTDTLGPTDTSALVHDDRAATAAIRDTIRQRVGSRAQLKVKHHVQSLLFGLGFGGLVVLIVLFSFFNEVIIAPFIQPGRSVSATPIIIGADGVGATTKNEVLIPKINLEIPLDFSAKTIDENEIENGLNNGVVHYPTTSLPGQQGNAAFFGHSSNNIFNPGKYKFAFVLLHELEPGDTFYLSYNGVMYAYQVYDKKVVEPTDVSVLNNVPGKVTATLITCDPPGTSLRRLVVWGEQVSPNPSNNAAAAPPVTANANASQEALPGNGPTLWRRLLNALSR